jgi:hypothetical protein
MNRLLPLCAVGVCTIATALFGPPALAAGKAQLGCSSPYQLGTFAEIEAFSQPLVDAGFFTSDSLAALLGSLDHNGDGVLCWKTPSGWLGPPATNGANRADFVNLVDDKIVG